MKGIRKVKTWNGLKYGIVNLNTKPVYSPKGKLLYTPIEMDVLQSEKGPLLFPYTNTGLSEAREVLTKN